MAEWRQVLKPPAGALPKDVVRTVGLCALTLVILGMLASSLWTGSGDDAGAGVPGGEPTLTGAGQVAQLTSRLTDLQDEQQRQREREAAQAAREATAAQGLASWFGGPGTAGVAADPAGPPAGDGDRPEAAIGAVGGTAPGALLTPDEIELRARLRLEGIERRTRSLRAPAVIQTFRTPPAAGAVAPAQTGPPAAPAGPVAAAAPPVVPPFDPGAVLSEITDAARAAAQAAGGEAEPPAWERTVPGVTGPDVAGTAEAVTVTTPTDPPGWERVYEGAVVSAVLVTQLSGEFAGPVQAQVSIPFYSADRQRILVPRGARFLGTVQPVRHQDQSRLAVGFHRLVWPDGQWVDLAFHGLNAVGEGALADQVNRHYVSMFAAAGAVGVLSGLTVSGATPYGGGREGFQAGVSQGLGQSASQMLDRFLNRFPAIHDSGRAPAPDLANGGCTRAASRGTPRQEGSMNHRGRWVVVGVLAVVLCAAGPWATRRVQACGGIGLFSINCDGIIIANQMVQIGHMVSQIGQMVNQLRSLDGVLTMTTELVSSNDPAMGNLGRVRDMLDRQWQMAKDGTGLTTDASGVGAFIQRIPGVTDAGNWLAALAPAGTALLGTRPATATGAAATGAFAGWALPDEGANLAVLASLEDMGDGTRSYRGVWEDMVSGGDVATLLTPVHLEALSDDPEVRDRLLAEHAAREGQASAALVHAHAEADAASFLVQQVGASAAALADLRLDDLTREQRVPQATLAALSASTELAVAQGQLAAYRAAREARERYEAERARRAARAAWHASVAAGRAELVARDAAWAAETSGRQAAARYYPSSRDWGW